MSFTDQKIIFVTGASRSGTTLLSFVLGNHRSVFGLKELHFFGQTWDPRSETQFTHHQAIEAVASIFAHQQDGVLSWSVTDEHRREAAAVIEECGEGFSDPASLFAAAVLRLTKAAGKSIPCEQTPRNVFYGKALLEAFPASHIVHIVRDPRAVMASQKKRWQRRHLAADGKAVPRYASLRVWVNYHPYTAARLWSAATDRAVELIGHPRVTLIRFEDLVQRPEETVRGLCDSLHLDYDRHMLDVEHINSSHQSSVGGARKGLHADTVDKWRDALDRAEIAIAERYCGAHMRHFGYEMDQCDPDGNKLAELGYRLRYIAHLGGVLLVNPRRALIQVRAMSPGRFG
jgi:omega-hydroxy-beta-dihydromenaquinone-9 sulfotransferase